MHYRRKLAVVVVGADLSWPFAAVSALCIALGASCLAAQSANNATAGRAIACIDTLSLKPTKQMLVYVRDVIGDSTDSEFGQMADLFTQSISQHVRHLLHGKGEVLPSGEPAITWRQIESQDASHSALQVTVHRESATTFSITSPAVDSVAGNMLLRAANEAVAVGEGTFWPSETPGDSMQFAIEFVLPPLGQAFPVGADRVVFPTFSVRFPAFTPVAITSTSAPEYPPLAKQIKATGVIMVDFDVDSIGQVPTESIKDVWLPGKPRPTGDALAIYNEFLNSVIRWLPTAQFAPGRIGSCPIRQHMRQPITFELPGGGG